MSGIRPLGTGRFLISEAERLPRLYAILDTAAYEAKGFTAFEAAQTLLEAGVRLIQYRHKGQFTEERFQEARRIAGACRASRALLIMNDRADYGRLLGCGVHLGQRDLSAPEARKIVGPDVPVGLSTHNELQLRRAADLPVDYVALGPVFHTHSKTNPDPVIGLSELLRLSALTHFPLVAIGGIGIESALSVLDSGAAAVAVISGLLPERAGDLGGLRMRAREWLKAIEGRSLPM
ncbi:MAG: thiamine phosphate synthase [Bryobacteraceae bacterium]